jgi:hypothetical protein
VSPTPIAIVNRNMLYAIVQEIVRVYLNTGFFLQPARRRSRFASGRTLSSLPSRRLRWTRGSSLPTTSQTPPAVPPRDKEKKIRRGVHLCQCWKYCFMDCQLEIKYIIDVFLTIAVESHVLYAFHSTLKQCIHSIVLKRSAMMPNSAALSPQSLYAVFSKV